MNNSQQQNQLFTNDVTDTENKIHQLFTNDISSTEDKIKTQSLPTGPFIYDMPNH